MDAAAAQHCRSMPRNIGESLFVRNLLFWGLLPFALPQAIILRKSAPRVTQAGGPKQRVVGSGPTFSLVAIGDSIISGVGAVDLSDALVGQTALAISSMLDCRISWTALGSIGANSNKVIHRLVPQLPHRPADFVIVSVGVNDVTSLLPVSTWKRNLNLLIRLLTDRYPHAIIAVAGIPPLQGFPLLPRLLRRLFGNRGETFDTVIHREVKHYPRALHVPLAFEPHPDKFSADGFHPSEASYQEYGQVMAGCIVDRFKLIATELSRDGSQCAGDRK